MSIAQSVINDPVVIPYGSALLSVHLFLVIVFKYLCPDGPWKQTPSFTAHQVIALASMTFCTYQGFVHYQGQGMLEVNEGGIFLSRFAMGAMLLWDIPVSFLSNVDVLMQLHHVAFFIVSSIGIGFFSDGVPIASQYAPFFFGVVELSSIPLVIVDVFHPRQKEWNEYVKTAPMLNSINELCRVAFALLFVIMRVIYFPYVVFSAVVPDCLETLQTHPEYSTPLNTIMVLSALFTVLQLYWGYLVIKQIVKALSGGGGDTKKKKE